MLTTRVRALELVELNVTLEVDLACACVWCVAAGFALGFGFGLGRGLTTEVAAAAAVARGAVGRAPGIDTATDFARRSLAGTRDANECPDTVAGEDGTTTGAN